MAIREILLIPDKRLKQVSKPILEIDKSIFKLVDDMFETMYEAPGIGLAAPQIGVMKQIIIMDCSNEEQGEKPDPIAMINPKIVFFSEQTRVHEEGCLSIPEYFEEIERPDNIRVRYQDVAGKKIEREASGVLATCIQHEIDHLEGRLFIDYLSRLKRERIMKKFQKLARKKVG